MSGIKDLAKNIATVDKLRTTIKALPLRIRTAVARDAAEVLTWSIREQYDAGRTVYDTPRPLSVDGDKLTLKKSGTTRATLSFVTVGTIVRAQLSTKYSKYLVGKYKVLPQRLPIAYSEALQKIVREYIEDFESEVNR